MRKLTAGLMALSMLFVVGTANAQLVIGYDSESVDGVNRVAGAGYLTTPFTVASNKEVDTLSAYMSPTSAATGIDLALFEDNGGGLWFRRATASGAVGFTGVGWLTRSITPYTLVPGKEYALGVTTNGAINVRRDTLSGVTSTKVDLSGVTYPFASVLSISDFSSTDTKEILMYASLAEVASNALFFGSGF